MSVDGGEHSEIEAKGADRADRLAPGAGAGSVPAVDETDLAVVPLERAETLPARWYVESGFCSFDRDHLLSRHWQYAGPAQKLAKAGDLMVAEIAGRPVVAVRDGEARTRAFYNVCRHRGGPLATEDGCVQSLRCRYHGWTYGLDGSLRGVPEFEGVEGFERSRVSLVPVDLEVWQGLVFVRLKPGLPAPPDPTDPPGLAGDGASFAAQFAGVEEELPPPGIAAMTFAHRDRYALQCNWKVYVDNFLEGYHLPFVHPALNRLLDYRSYATELSPRHSLQHAPVVATDGPYPVSGGRALYFFLFPNIMLNVLPGRVQVNAVIPLSADRSEVIFDYFYDEGVMAAGALAEALARDREYSDVVQQEDIEICERVQRGLASGAYERGRFSVKRESGVHHFQSLIKRAYRNARSTGHPRPAVD